VLDLGLKFVYLLHHVKLIVLLMAELALKLGSVLLLIEGH
jgi:hypothetical protein